MIVLHAFCFGKCDICDKEIQSGHIPCDKVCEECSEKLEVCKVCGKKFSDGDDLYSHYDEEHNKGI